MSMYERDSDFPIRVSEQSEFGHVVSKQSEAFDADDLSELTYEKSAELLALLNVSDAEAIGKLIINAKAELVFSRAQHEYFGRIVFKNKTAGEKA